MTSYAHGYGGGAPKEQGGGQRRFGRAAAMLALSLLLLLASAHPAGAYVGPGAGFALLSSFLVLFTTTLAAVASLLFWPFRMLWRRLRHGPPPRARIRRLVIVGLDGQDPGLTDRFMAQGLLPNFKKLAEAGCYRRLQTTFPSVSPVAWSSFSTGTQPGRHNIFDFLDRDRRTYLPVLSSAHLGRVERFFRLGRYRIPREKPELRLLRKSKPFWVVLGEHRVWSTILRVPITFPPDKFYGAELSAMSVPDLLGTQGTFLLFTTRPAGERFKEGGTRIAVTIDGDRIVTAVEGPENPFAADSRPLQVPLRISIDRSQRHVEVATGNSRVVLTPGALSDWVTLRFRAAPGIAVSGITRLLVIEMDDHFSMYMSPINIDPEKPAMPVSHPLYYSMYLAKRIGPYATLGLAEDTWALNEGVTDEGTFLQQTYDIDRERQDMFFSALSRLRKGTLVCVFDATDRIQHMFWRYLDAAHPARTAEPSQHQDAIEELYRHNDAMVGRVMQQMGEQDVLMVVSDHGFNSFRRGVNINSWLHREGYLVLKPGVDGRAEWLRDVDWSATRAYCIGLTGMFINVEGREAQGIVGPGADATALKAEIIARLNGLPDAERDAVAIREVFDTSKLYTGPYAVNAPDLLIGYNEGYRVSWDGATGIVAGPVFDDNTRPWSGDHCIDPRLVPGIFVCNRSIEASEPALVDIAPTALRLFGIDPPAYMDGRPLAGLV
jgi:predicted AlkP superfamily phosphohydrolase/phosphomutase